jgi:hypothetical protein
MEKIIEKILELQTEIDFAIAYDTKHEKELLDLYDHLDLIKEKIKRK